MEENSQAKGVCEKLFLNDRLLMEVKCLYGLIAGTLKVFSRSNMVLDSSMKWGAIILH